MRRPDPRIASAIRRALGGARSLVNVGAGAGAYEPDDLDVIPVEPSATMRAQRPPGAARALAAYAEALPLADGSVDAALAVLALHHFDDPLRALAEMRRVARGRVVLLTFDAARAEALWLVRDYLPEIAELDRARFVPMPLVVEALGGTAHVEPVPVPHDCTDGFQGAYWRRPQRYLDPAVQAGISTFGLLPRALLSRGLARLAEDLRTGEWDRRNAHLRELDELDLGYRLVRAEVSSSVSP